MEFIKSISPDAFIGLLGVVLGSFLTLFTNSISKQGRLHFYVKSFTDTFELNEHGSIVESNSLDMSQFFHFDLELEIYNSSREPKMVRDVKIFYRNNSKTVFEFIPKDDASLHKVDVLRFYDDLDAFTVEPKSVKTIKVHNGLNDQEADLNLFGTCDNVVLKYKNEYGRSKTIKVVRQYRLPF